MSWEIREGEAARELEALPDRSVHCCVTSPPYWGLRDYGAEGQLGLESNPDDYVDRLVGIFDQVARVLRDDGTVWLNLGDTYAAKARGSDVGWETSRLTNPGHVQKAQAASLRGSGERHRGKGAGLKEKDLVGIPWMAAFALRSAGWYLRRDVVWSKSNPMPESVRDRPTSAHEYLFLLTKSPRYFYDAEAIKEPDCGRGSGNGYRREERLTYDDGKGARGQDEPWQPGGGRNKRSVWEIATRPFPDAHFATFPPQLVEPCILAGTAPGGLVLDPFAGAATTGLVAAQLGRRFLGIEINPEYAAMGRARIERWEANPAGYLTGDPEPIEGQMGLID
jgi:DNA modification methylase